MPFKSQDQQFESVGRGWDLEVNFILRFKVEWVNAKVVDINRGDYKVMVTYLGESKVDSVAYKDIRIPKNTSYITNTFPCPSGAYGHINPIIKQLIEQPIQELDNGLFRKSIPRKVTYGDDSLLESLKLLLKKIFNQSSYK